MEIKHLEDLKNCLEDVKNQNKNRTKTNFKTAISLKRIMSLKRIWRIASLLFKANQINVKSVLILSQNSELEIHIKSDHKEAEDFKRRWSGFYFELSSYSGFFSFTESFSFLV